MNEKETISYDNWEIQRYGKGTPYPFILVDNWYLPFEEKSIWSEIEFYERNIFIRGFYYEYFMEFFIFKKIS